MKKSSISILAASSILLLLCSCGEEKKDSSSASQTQVEAQSPAEIAAETPAQNDSQEIMDDVQDNAADDTSSSTQEPVDFVEDEPDNAAAKLGTSLKNYYIRDALVFDPYQNFKANANPAMYSFPDFYPLGWSPDGKFMWATSVANEGRGGTDLRLYLQDLVSDEMLWTKFIAYEEDDNFSSYAANALDAAAQDNQSELKQIVEKYGIVSGHTAFFPTNELFELSSKDTVKGENEMGFPVIDYTVTAKSKSSGKSKVLTSKKDVDVFSTQVCGIIPSPFENRIAVIIAEEVFVFEGTGIEYSIAGCHTKVGF